MELQPFAAFTAASSSAMTAHSDRLNISGTILNAADQGHDNTKRRR